MKKIVLFTVVSVAFLGMVACSSQKTDNIKEIYLRFLGGDMSRFGRITKRKPVHPGAS